MYSNDVNISDNLNITINSFNGTISKVSANIITENLDKVYTGNPYDTTDINVNSSNGATYSFLDKNSNPIDIPTNVGTYYLVAEIASDNYTTAGTVIKEFKITPATINLGDLTNQKVTFTGDVVFPNIVSSNYPKVSLMVTPFADNDLISVGTQKGYVVMANNDANYVMTSDNIIEYEIVKAKISLIINDVMNYTGEAWSKSLNDYNNNDRFVIDGLISTKLSSLGQYNNIEDFNYEGYVIYHNGINVTNSVDLVIEHIFVTIKYPSIDFTVVDGVYDSEANVYKVSYTYDGNIHKALVESSVKNVSIIYYSEGLVTTTPISSQNVIKQSISFTLSARNYENTIGTIEFEIKELELTLKHNDNIDKEFDQKSYNFEYKLYSIYDTDFENPVTVSDVKVEYYNKYGARVSQAARVGDYKVKVYFEGNDNIKAFEFTYDFKITPTDANISIDENYHNQMYTGKSVLDPKVYTYTSNKDAISFKYYNYDDYDFDTNSVIDGKEAIDNPSTLGKYVVVVTVAKNNDYNETSKAFTFEIISRTAVVQWENFTFTYDGKPHVSTAYIDGIEDRINLDVKIYKDEARTIEITEAVYAGKYYLKAVLPTSDGLYNINSVAVMEIMPRRVEVIYENPYVEYQDEISFTFTSDGTYNNIFGYVKYDDGTYDVLTLLLAVRKSEDEPIELKVYKNTDFDCTVISAISPDGTDVSSCYYVDINAFISVHKKMIEYSFENANNGVITYTYDGQPHSVIGTASEGCTILYNGNGKWTDQAPIYVNAGNYHVGYKIIGEGYETIEGTITISIEKISYDIEVISKAVVDYNGLEYKPEIRINNYDGIYEVTYKYYSIDDVSRLNPMYSISEAGSYNLEITVFESQNYKVTKKNSVVIIQKIDSVLTVDENELSKVYDSLSFDLSYEVITDGDSNVYYYDITDTALSNPLASAPVNAGRYFAQVKVTNAKNYSNMSFEPVVIEIKKAQVTISSDTIVYEYTGNSYIYNFDVFNKNEPDSLVYPVISNTLDGKYRFVGNIETKGSNRGYYYSNNGINLVVEVYYQDELVTSNFEFLLEITVKIDDANASSLITVNDYNGIYDGNSYGIEIIVDENLNGSYSIVYSSNNISFQSLPVVYSDCGNYKVFYTITFENYKTITGYAFINIEKADISIDEDNILASDMEYNGKEYSDPVVNAFADGKIVYKYYNLADYDLVNNIALGLPLDTAPIHAGEYVVVVDYVDLINFNPLTSPVFKTFTITKKIINVTWKNTVMEYSGNLMAPTAHPSTVTFDEVVVTVSGHMINKGKYIATATIDNLDYEIKNNTQEFEIITKVVEIPEKIIREYTDDFINPVDFTTLYTSNMYKDVGEYTITITLVDKDNYVFENGLTTATTTLVITEMNLASENVKVEEINFVRYTGEAVEPKPVVYYKDTLLIENVDYRLSYINNVEPSMFKDNTDYAYVVIEGIGNYTGSTRIKFRILSDIISITSGKAKLVELTGLGKYNNNYVHNEYNDSKTIVITNIASKTTITKFLSMLEENQRSMIRITDTKGYIVSTNYDTTYIGTGFKIEVIDYDKTVLDKVTVVIAGDISGDGIIDSVDATYIRNYCSGYASFDKLRYYAADIDHDGYINYSEYYMILSYMNGSYDFETSYK